MTNLLLSNLPIGTVGEVTNLNCNGSVKKRLLDLGIINGTKIVPVFKSPSGDPTAFFVRGYTIALRKEDTNLIEIKINKKLL